MNSDHHDISKPWKDGVAMFFLGAVGSPIPWNLHGPNAIKEKFGVGKAMYYVHHL